MAHANARRCVCGKYPKIKEEVSYYGGSRYKGKTKVVTWKAKCRGCWRRESDTSQERVTKAWNTTALLDCERRDTPDKMIYDLQHASSVAKQALARLLMDVEAIKKKLGI